MLDFSKLKFVNNAWVIILPLTLMAIDIVSGYINAWQEKNVNSAKMRSGLVKKSGEIIEILIVELLGASVGLPLEVVQGISAYISFTEIISIAENLSKMGVPMPAWLTDRLNNEYKKINESEAKK